MIRFKIINPNEIELAIDVQVLNCLTYEIHHLEVLKGLDGLYHTMTELALDKTQYVVSVKVSNQNLSISLSDEIVIQNNPIMLIAKGEWSSEQAPTFSIIGDISPYQQYTLKIDGQIQSFDTEINLENQKEIFAKVEDSNNNIVFSTLIQVPEKSQKEVNFAGTEAQGGAFSEDHLAISVISPIIPKKFRKSIVGAHRQKIKGKLSKTYQSLFIINTRNQKVIVPHLSNDSALFYEYQSELTFLEEGENNLILRATFLDVDNIVRENRLSYTIIFDRHHPTVQIDFGEQYSEPIPQIKGYISLYSALTVANSLRKNDDYQFKIKISDDYFLGNSIDEIKNRLSIKIANQAINWDDFEVREYDNFKNLELTIKNECLIPIRQAYSSFPDILSAISVQVRDYADNYYLNYRQFHFVSGKQIGLNLIPRNFQITSAPDSTKSENLASVYLNNMEYQLKTEEIEIEPGIKVLQNLPQQTIAIAMELYEYGAIEQAKLRDNSSFYRFYVLNNVYDDYEENPSLGYYIKISKMIGLSHFITEPKPGQPYFARGIYPLQYDIPNKNSIFSILLWDKEIKRDLWYSGFNLDFGKPDLVYSKKRELSIDSESSSQVANFIFNLPGENYDGFGVNFFDNILGRSEPYNLNDIKEELRLYFPEKDQSVYENKYIIPSHEVFLIKNFGELTGTFHDDFTIDDLLSKKYLVSSNVFKSSIEIDRSHEPSLELSFIERPIGWINDDYIINNINLDPSVLYVHEDRLADLLLSWLLEAHSIFDKYDNTRFYEDMTVNYFQKKGDNDNVATVEVKVKYNQNFEWVEALELREEKHHYTFQDENYSVDIIKSYHSLTSENIISYYMFPRHNIKGESYVSPFIGSFDCSSVDLGGYSYRASNSLNFQIEGFALSTHSNNNSNTYLSDLIFSDQIISPNFESNKNTFFPMVKEVYITPSGKLAFQKNFTDADDLLEKMIYGIETRSEDFNLVMDTNPVKLGLNIIKIGDYKYEGKLQTINMHVLVEDGDFNTNTTDDYYVKGYYLNFPYQLPSLTLPSSDDYFLTAYFVEEQENLITTISSENNKLDLHYNCEAKTFTKKKLRFITPSYYYALTHYKFEPIDDMNYFLARPGETVRISSPITHELNLKVKGVALQSSNGASDFIELDQNYTVVYFDNMRQKKNSRELEDEISLQIESYSKEGSLIESYASSPFNQHEENDEDEANSNQLDLIDTSIHSTLSGLLPAFRFVTTKTSNLQNGQIKVEPGGFVIISCGTAKNIYSVKLNEKEQTYEAITGITPRLGAGISIHNGLVDFNSTGTVTANNQQFIYTETDITVPTRMGSISFIRTYRSGSDVPSVFGYGWDHNFNRYFEEDDEDNLVWYQGNARHDKILSTKNAYQLPDGFLCEIKKLEPNTIREYFHVDYPDGSFEEYHQFKGKYYLSKIEDPNGNQTIITRNGNQITIHTDNNQEIVFTGSSLNGPEKNITYVIAGLKLAKVNDDLLYSYTNENLSLIKYKNQNLLSITYDESNKVVSQRAKGRIYQFTSLANGVSETVSAEGLPSLTTNYQMSDEYPISIQIEGQSNQISFAAYQKDIMRIGEVIDRKGIRTKTTYRQTNNIFEKGLVEKIEVFPNSNSNTTQQARIEKSFTYTSKTLNDHPVYLIEKEWDPLGNYTKYEYDQKANLIRSSVEPDEGELITQYKRDRFGRVAGVLSPDGTASANFYYDYIDESLTISANSWLRRTITDSKSQNNGLARIDELLAMDNDSVRENPELQVIDFAYDERGNLTTTIDSLGRMVIKEYDSYHRLIRTEGPEQGGHGRVKVRYLYDGKKAGEQDLAWPSWTTSITEIPYPQISNSQGAPSIQWGKLISRVDREFDQYGRLLLTKSNEQKSENKLDAYGRVLASIQYGSSGAPDQYTSYQYDQFSRLNKMIIGDDDTDASNGVTSSNTIASIHEYEFDANDNIIASKLNGELISQTTLDGYDRAIGQVDFSNALGSSHSLDAAGNVLETKVGQIDHNASLSDIYIDQTNEIDKLGTIISSTDKLRKDINGNLEPATSKFSYSIKNNLVKFYNPNDINNENASTTVSNNGLIKTTKYPDGSLLIEEYNQDGSLKYTTQDESQVAGAGDEIQKRRIRYEYDASGFLVKDIVQKWQAGEFVDPAGSEIIAQNTYLNDGVGRPILITDARGNQTKNEYNNLRQLISVTTGFASANPITKVISYYPNGLVQSETQASQSTSYEYNAVGALQRIIYQQDTKIESEEYSYNNKGLLKEVKLRHAENQAATVLNYFYDYELGGQTNSLVQIRSANKILREFRDFEMGQAKTVIEHNRHFANGDIDSSGDVITKYQFNSNRQVISEENSLRDFNNKVHSSRITRHYNKAGDLSHLQYPSQNYRFDYQYNLSNQLIAIKNGNQSIKEFSYYGFSKPALISEAGSKLKQSLSYDKQNWLQSITNSQNNSYTGSFAYQYENNGVKKSVNHELASGLQKTDAYEYDSHNRLIEANYTGKQFGQDRFYLDSLDNITDGLMNAQPIKTQIKEAVRIAQSNEVHFLYDTRGNTIEDERYQYEWDDFDRIRSIKNKAINPENYVQDRPYEALSFETASENHLLFTMAQDDQAPVTVNSLFINKEVVNSLYLEYKLFSNEENWQSLVISRSLINTVEHSTRIDFSDISARQIRLTELASSGQDFVLLESENPQFQFKDYHYPEGIWSEIEYLYDASGRRVEKILDNRQAFWYSFDAYQMLEEKTFTSSDNTPKLRRQITYGKAINEPIYIYDAKANKNYYLLKNEQNTVLAVYDANDNTNASLKEQYEYSSYGITNILDASGNLKTYDHDQNPETDEIKKVKSDFENPFGYQGMWRDEHTGLYHTHYRLYDPSQVRWLTPDPAGYRDGQNLYRFYAGPNGVDVLGLDKLEKKKVKRGKQEYYEVWYTPEGIFGIDSVSLFVGMLDPKNSNNIIYTTGPNGISIEYDKLQKVADQWFSGIKTPDDFDNLVRGKTVTSNAPSLGKSMIPIVGSLANAEYAASRGDYGGFVLYSGLAVTDIFLLKSLAQGVLKGLGFKLFTTEAQASVKALGQVASHSDEVLASLSKIDPLKWKGLPLGVQIQEVGEFWIKRINPNKSNFFKWWGELSLSTQFSSLQKLKELATPSFLHGGMLFTKNVGQTLGGGQLSRFFNLTAFNAYLRGSWRLKNPVNDIVGRNMGTNGLIFDPALDWFSLNIIGTFSSTGAKATINFNSDKKSQLEK